MPPKSRPNTTGVLTLGSLWWAQLIARAVCAVVTVVDPELIVLGGGIGHAAGFVDAVASHLRQLAPVVPIEGERARRRRRR